MITRKEILSEAIRRFERDLYENSLPKVDFDELVRKAKNGEEDPKHPFYMQYYLPDEIFKDLLEEYESAYGIRSVWKDNVNTVLEYLKYGGPKLPWKKDEFGFKRYERSPKLEEVISKEDAEKVYELIVNCKDFYKFDSDESTFRFSAFLGSTPTSNKDAVIEYWKSQGVDLEIDEEKMKKEYFDGKWGDYEEE